MYNVKFDSNGESLRIDIQFKGANTVSYNYTLWEANSNNQVESHAGNNRNCDDDNYKLPTPSIVNNGRLIDVLSTIKNAEEQKERAAVSITVFQGQKILNEFTEDVFIEPKQTALNEIFIKLNAN